MTAVQACQAGGAGPMPSRDIGLAPRRKHGTFSHFPLPTSHFPLRMWSFLTVLAWLTVAVLAVGVVLKGVVWTRRAFLATVGPKQGDRTAQERVARLDRWAMRLLVVGLGLLAVVVVAGFGASYLDRPV